MFLVTTTTNTQTICSIAQHFCLQRYSPMLQPVSNLQWTCMSITQVKCDNMQTVLNNSVASHPRMNRKSFLGGGPDSLTQPL